MEYNVSPDLLNNEYVEIDALQMQELFEQESTVLIDVRERNEVPVLEENSCMQIPMSELKLFLETDTLHFENIILVCQHGIRSKVAAEALQEKYGSTKKIYSLKGGIVKSRNHFRIL
ncbi:MAG TPA: rhodanese-like domain-containing protein [Pedobacter sp.]|nr:rhodanese-like domain-containing protein [Pedobacter sp.]